jgi:hypothetical protein
VALALQVMRDPNGISRGSGFVAFSTSEEASRAVSIYISMLVFEVLNMQLETDKLLFIYSLIQ